MKILHVYKDYHPPVRGGIEQTIEQMARAQVAEGHDVTVLCSAHGGRRTLDERVDGVRVVRVGEVGRMWSAPLCPGMPAALAKLTADLVHLHYPNPTGEVSWLLARPRAPMVLSYYSDVVRQKAVMPVYGLFAERVLRGATRILVTSDRHLEHSRWLQRHRERTRVVPLGIDLERFGALEAHRPGGAALRQRLGTPLILFVGRLRYYKGLDVLLRAMPDVRGRLVIVGDGPERERLGALHASLGLGDRVTFAGDQDESSLLDHLAAADVGVLPSTYPSEVYGLSMVEMMACGIPVVCTELGTGTTFVNLNERTGLAVAPFDPAALAAALNRLLEDAALRARFGAAARERAHEVFSRPAMMRALMAVYAEARAAR
jgi:glycosyltransferase involved in cell wall biosynthesis